jgi:hypothetical protein
MLPSISLTSYTSTLNFNISFKIDGIYSLNDIIDACDASPFKKMGKSEKWRRGRCRRVGEKGNKKKERG